MSRESIVSVALIDRQFGTVTPIPEVKPAKHGCKWCYGKDYNTVFHVTVDMFHHSNGALSSHKIKAIYCPNCGAKLDQTYRGE